MKELLNQLRELSVLYTGENLYEDYKDLSKQPLVIAKVFVTNYRFISGRVRSIGYIVSEDECVSAVMRAIDAGLTSYDATKGAEINTWIITLIKQELNLLVRESNRGKNLIVRNSFRFDNLELDKDNEMEMKDMAKFNEVSAVVDEYVAESEEFLSKLNLSPSQEQYCRLLIANPSARDIDIANILKINRSYICKMKNAIKKKLAEINLDVAF